MSERAGEPREIEVTPSRRRSQSRQPPSSRRSSPSRWTPTSSRRRSGTRSRTPSRRRSRTRSRTPSRRRHGTRSRTPSSRRSPSRAEILWMRMTLEYKKQVCRNVSDLTQTFLTFSRKCENIIAVIIRFMLIFYITVDRYKKETEEDPI